jgi:hypothetical protein
MQQNLHQPIVCADIRVPKRLRPGVHSAQTVLPGMSSCSNNKKKQPPSSSTGDSSRLVPTDACPPQLDTHQAGGVQQRI